MSLLISCYVFINQVSSLIKTPVKKKFSILLNVFKLSCKNPIANIVGIKQERFLGMKATAFSYGLIKGLYQEIFIKQEYFFMANKKNPLIIDCGANIGLATLYFKWLYPESEIICFEPDPQTFTILKKNLRQNNLKKVTCHNAALWDSQSKVAFYTATKPGSPMMSTTKGRIFGKKMSVDAVPLSRFIKLRKVDFLKLDVEGAELRVLHELSSTGAIKNINKMVIEYHHKIKDETSRLGKFLEILEKNDFEYQIDARCVPLSSVEKYQDVMIHAYRRD